MNTLDGAGSSARVRNFGAASLLVGLLATLVLGYWLPELVPGFFPLEGTSRGDVGSRCLALANLCGFLAGVLVAGAGGVLVTARASRIRTARRLMSTAAGASLAMAALALVGGMLGDSKGGMKEATLIVLGLPMGLVLLVLSGGGVWWLRRRGD